MSASNNDQDKKQELSGAPFMAHPRFCFLIMALSFFIILGAFSPSVAQLYGVGPDEARAVPDASYIRASVDLTLKSGKVSGRRVFDKDALNEFYAARHYEPYWMSDTGPYSRVYEFVKVLEASWTHGLNPKTYHAEDIRALVQGRDFLNKNELELLLSDAFMRYARDLSGIRINPSGLKVDAASWQQPISSAQALSYLNTRASMRELLRQIEPQGRTYKVLREELIRLSKEGEEDYAGALPIRFDRVIRPADRHARISDVKMRLGVNLEGGRDDDLYNDRLYAAVIKFQREHGLRDDGILGSNTVQIMNRTNRKRIEQVVANLERLRWVEEKRPNRFVVVNIPAATLWAIDDGRVEFEMPVIVGKPARATESFVAQIQGVRFNPDWTIPPTIKRADILPKLYQNPGYLHQKGIQLLQGYGKNTRSLDPQAINWSGISARELNNLRMVQGPGASNPLGRVRILMPNKYNIYLHDTNHPEYFDKPARAVSSGCVRMKDPERMAQFLMSKEQGWRRADMDKVFATGKKTDIAIAHKMPVYVLYYTVWTDARGRVVYGGDIYNQDEKLFSKITNIDGFEIPRHNGTNMVTSSHRRQFVVNQ